MTSHTHLSAKHAPSTHFRTTSHAHLRRHHGVRTHFHVVRYLHQVVQFHSLAHNCAAHGGAIHTTVCTDFHAIFEGDDAYLWDFLIAFSRGSKAKAVCANDASAVQNNFITDFATTIHTHMGIKHTVFTDFTPLFEHHMAVDLRATTHCHSIANHGKGSNINVFAQCGGVTDKSQRMHPTSLLRHTLIKRQQFSNGFVSILHANECGRSGLFKHKILIDQDDARLRFIEVVRIFGIGQE